jgi:hypothetical protein
MAGKSPADLGKIVYYSFMGHFNRGFNSCIWEQISIQGFL